MKNQVIDYETTALDWQEGEVFAFCIADEQGDVLVRRVDTAMPKKNHLARKRMKRFWADTSIAKIAHNLKFELHYTENEGIEIPEGTTLHDTMIMSQILRNYAPSHALAKLCYELGGDTHYIDIDNQVQKQAKARKGYHNVDKPLMKHYQIHDGERGMHLFQLLWPEIKAGHLLEEYTNEVALTLATMRLERFGIMVCEERAHKLMHWLERKLKDNEALTFKEFGEFVNWSSPTQCKRYLYKIRKYPILKYTPDRQPSTDKDVLLELRERHPKDPLFNILLKYRSYERGMKDIQSYLDLRDRNGILRPTININAFSDRKKNARGGRTGRQSAENPNLMNVSKSTGEKNPFPVPARRAFRARTRHFLLFVDYSGIELRLIIGLSNCKKMIRQMKQGEQIHELAARQFYPKKFKSKKENISLYDAGKNGHFCICYGGGPAKLALTINIPKDQGTYAYERYRAHYPENLALHHDIGQQVTKEGYVETPFGRRLYLPVDQQYAGLNYLIQGTAAGILKRAEVALDKYFQDEWDDDVRLVMPIHDELVISAPRTLWPKRKELLHGIEQHMIHIPHIKVPLEIEAKSTFYTWDSAKPIAIPTGG